MSLRHGTEAAISCRETKPRAGDAVALYPAQGGRKAMKLICAVVRPHCLEDIRSVAAKLGLEGLTVSETGQHTAGPVLTEVYRGAEYRSDWEPRIRIELAVADEGADQLVEAICNIARTGREGDGDVFLSTLAEAIRIRTGETGATAV
jgi:nitrogen regulatory protein P-II 2